MSIREEMKRALKNTRKQWLSNGNELKSGELHSRLSKDWIEGVADLLRHSYLPESGYRVFSRGYDCNRSAFRVNEYLYDISVIKVGTVASASGHATLEYPIETEWHIESEFCANDSRASMVDFGKLLMSAARKKCMVLPAGGKIQAWAEKHLSNLARSSSGAFEFAFVPHPKYWLLSDEPTVEFLEK